MIISRHHNRLAMSVGLKNVARGVHIAILGFDKRPKPVNQATRGGVLMVPGAIEILEQFAAG